MPEFGVQDTDQAGYVRLKNLVLYMGYCVSLVTWVIMLIRVGVAGSGMWVLKKMGLVGGELSRKVGDWPHKQVGG